MPREQRKRGKKHKAKNDDVIEDTTQVASSSAIPVNDNQLDGLHSDTPFGHVDPDVKAYFKTVDDQLKEWQNEGVDAEVDIDLDPNERKLLWLLHVIKSQFFFFPSRASHVFRCRFI